MNAYHEFLSSKLRHHGDCGFVAESINVPMFPHQDALTRWAIRKGRCAIFADTGLGKTRMQLAWADAIHRATGKDVLILAPLAVADQTCREGSTIGIDVAHVFDGSEVQPGISITNYDRLHRIDASRFGAVVLDESSIIKHHDAATLKLLIAAFADTPYRLCATATPAPNDWSELGTHAEFLGVCSRVEMLSEFFCHDGGETQVWRLKGHARKKFWQWVSSWGAMIRSPSDLGFDDSAYVLPQLDVQQVDVETDAVPFDGELFAREATTLSDRRNARRNSLSQRVAACADDVNGTNAPWVIWAELNAEGDAIVKAIPDAVEVRGSDTAERKERVLSDFANGKVRVLVTKPKIAGFGLNWQHCSHVAFIGVTDSFEAYYQAIRRCWRFGQKNDVHVRIYVSNLEGAVRDNLMRKERDAIEMFRLLSEETRDAVRDSVIGQSRYANTYDASQRMKVPEWLK